MSRNVVLIRINKLKRTDYLADTIIINTLSLGVSVWKRRLVGKTINLNALFGV